MDEQIVNVFYLSLILIGFCSLNILGICCCIREKKKKKYTIIDEYEIIS